MDETDRDSRPIFALMTTQKGERILRLILTEKVVEYLRKDPQNYADISLTSYGIPFAIATSIAKDHSSAMDELHKEADMVGIKIRDDRQKDGGFFKK